MTRFNTKQNTSTTNHEGAKAYSLSPELELYTLVVTSMFSDKFYESADGRLDRLRNLIVKVEPEFVAKLAIYAREKMYLRTMPLILMIELAKVHNGTSLVGNALSRVVQRADEITETLAYYSVANKRTERKKLGKLSRQVERGLDIAFNKFDEYQFGKYNRKSEITLRDALFVIQPKATNEEQSKLFDKIAKNELKTPFTWETELSAKGNTAEVWSGLINSGRLPYMAALRNLRNMLEANVSSEDIKTVAQLISSPEQVKKSKQLPFRFLSAHRELKGVAHSHTSMLLNALEDALQASVENLKGFDYNTTVAIACDVSGSMQSPISAKSKIQNYDIGLLLGMLLQHKSKAVVSGMFGDHFKIVNLPQSSILQNVDELYRREGEVGYSTNGYLVLDTLLKQGVNADKVMMFTDCQMWDSHYGDNHMQKSWAAYRKANPSAKLYLFDLSGYGDTPVRMGPKGSGDGVYLIAGWSDKVFDVMDAYEKGSSAIEHINEIVI